MTLERTLPLGGEGLNVLFASRHFLGNGFFLRSNFLLCCYFSICFCAFDERADLFVHVKLHVVVTAAVLAARAGALPATEGLEARPGAGCRALWAVGIGDTGFDIVKEPVSFFGRSVETGGETVIDVVGDLHGFVKVGYLTNRGDREEHLILPQAMLIG